MNYSNISSTGIFVIKLLTFLNVKIPRNVIQKGCKLIENTSQKYKLSLYHIVSTKTSLLHKSTALIELNRYTMFGFHLTEV